MSKIVWGETQTQAQVSTTLVWFCSLTSSR